MRNVVWSRVDDRLIHGEVVTAWTPSMNANCILIVDDGVAADTFNKRVIKSLAPAGVKVFVITVEKAAERLVAEGRPGERIIVLTKSPIAFAQLIDAGVPIRQVNLGGMGIRGNRRPFVKNVSASPEEVDAIERMREKGVRVFYQLVPEQGVTEVDDAIIKKYRSEA
ncbi:PTS sugar transporter subunit IIB [Olsenella massiliensis]|uniref:PTS sugar transporter subunit IIB n=1 Tax=Olsenella massiliensis TaxID=1622075 RepID=UPI00071DAFEE|nr:PTS sugar transporter subunit IIB [Olsenella massiliensis]